MAGNTPQQPDPQEVHDDLMATLAASRELGPEMDKSLAENYIQRHPELAAKKQAVTQEPPRTPLDLNRSVAGLLPVLGIAAFIIILVATHGRGWWLFWLPWALGGWWWWGGGRYHDRHMARDEMRRARYESRAAYYRDRARRYGGDERDEREIL
ncbi:MAG TPA: hypothetical protein VE258_05635 [Ktedonobacterales bacterium]|nr:hypothetical protein [Ktedonobacterales bacterium]